MSYLLSPPLKFAPATHGPTTTYRPSQLPTGTWLIFQFKNRAHRQSPKRPLPTPSGSTNDNSTQSITPSVEGWVSPRNDNGIASFNNPYSYDSSSQSQRAASAPPRQALRSDSEPAIKKEPAYIGDNSFRSIFQESLGLVASDPDASAQQNAPVGADSIAHGCRLLGFFKHRWIVNDFIDQWFEVTEGADEIAIEGIIKGMLRKLWLCHGEVLEQQDPDKLYRLSELLWRNTQTPIIFNGNTSVMEWIDLTTGPNIRWEVIGMIAAIVGTCAMYSEASNPIFKKHDVVRLTLAKQANVVSNACVAFSHKCEAINDAFVWLLIEDWSCTTLFKGVHKFEAYRQGGDIVSTVVFLKWHHKIEANDKVPLFLAELRKRARFVAYCAEIGNSSFLGQPPRASYHYWDLEPPADLRDIQLMLDKPDIEFAISQLDANGFNTTGELDRGTWMRTWMGFAMQREDILDLTLRNYSREEIIKRAAEIERKGEAHWQSLPNWMREARNQKINPAQKLLRQLYLTVFRHGTRANELLLQRILIRKAQASPERMIQVSQTIFKEVLEAGFSQEMTSKFQMDITSLLVVHGLRAAAIIAVELLKQEQSPSHEKEPLLPRSQTIQDLSVFNARLNVIDPSDPMYGMSQDGHKMLSLVLDRILAPKPVEPQAPASQCPDPQSHQQPPLQQLGYGQMDLDIMGNAGAPCIPGVATAIPMEYNSFAPPDWLLTNENDTMFMQWLENVDWERQGPWAGI